MPFQSRAGGSFATESGKPGESHPFYLSGRRSQKENQNVLDTCRYSLEIERPPLEKVLQGRQLPARLVIPRLGWHSRRGLDGPGSEPGVYPRWTLLLSGTRTRGARGY